MQPANFQCVDTIGNVRLSHPSPAVVILQLLGWKNLFSTESSFAGEGSGYPGGHQVKHKLSLHPCNKEGQGRTELGSHGHDCDDNAALK